MAGFYFKSNQYGAPSPENEVIRIANSVTVLWGGLVRIVVTGNPTANGGVVTEDVAAGESIFGLCDGFTSADGIAIENLNSPAGTFTDGAYGIKSYASTATNLTVALMAARVRPLSYHDIMRNLPDAARGTTAGSTTRYNYTDTVDSVSIDENNAAAAFTTVAQLIIWGTSPENTTDVLCKAKELQDENG